MYPSLYRALSKREGLAPDLFDTWGDREWPDPKW